MSDTSVTNDPLAFLAGGGEAERMIRERNWTGHPLGSPETWPTEFKAALSLVLNSPESMILAWGEELSFFFNETYFPLLGPRLPWAMGERFDKVWADGWAQAKPIIDAAFAGNPEHFDDLPWKLGEDRGARDTWWSFSYSRVLDAKGDVAGLFIFTNETTARVLGDAALRESEESLRRVVEGATDHAILTTDAEGVIRSWSRGAQEIFGWTPNEAIGQSAAILFTPEDRAAGVDARELLTAADRGVANDKRWHLAKSGRLVFLSGSVHPLPPDAQGRASGFIKVARDETDRWEAEQAAAKEAEGQRRSLQRDRDELWELSRDIMLRCGFDGRILTVNPAWTAVLGWQEDELVGGSLFDLIHPDDMEHSIEGAQAHAEGTSYKRFENRYRHKGGGYRWISWSTRPTDTVITAVGRDVTDKRHSEKRQALLFDLILHQRQAVDEQAVLAAAAAAVGSFLQVDRAGFFELPDSETVLFGVGWTAGDLPLLGGEFPAVGIGVDALRRIRRGETIAFSDARSDAVVAGSVFPQIDTLAGVGTPIMRQGRWMAGIYLNDRQPRRWLDEEIALTREIADLTWDTVERLRGQAELATTQEALRQSQKMEAVGQLTGGLAHDFNNLLAGISGALELMGRRIQQGRITELEKYMVAAQGAAKRAAALTHRLLAFSRRQTLQPKPTNVNNLVTGMLDLIQRTVGPSVRVDAATVSGLWTGMVDASQLENALLNLCLNARDAMPEGGNLTIETANRYIDRAAAKTHDLPEGQYLSLCVSDTGTGMTADVIAKAFDPFFTTKPIGQGTGLGLSMIYGFARQSGGQVRIYSEVGQGTMVCIYLPRHRGEVDADEIATESRALPLAEAGETVLIVDDEPTVRLLVTDVLADLGYTSIEAADSAGGLRVLESDARVDLLITDVGLPGMNGRQMVNAARVHRPDLKVLFITGFAENALLNNGQLEPGMSVLTKPFAVDVLAARIRELIAA